MCNWFDDYGATWVHVVIGIDYCIWFMVELNVIGNWIWMYVCGLWWKCLGNLNIRNFLKQMIDVWKFWLKYDGWIYEIGLMEIGLKKGLTWL